VVLDRGGNEYSGGCGVFMGRAVIGASMGAEQIGFSERVRSPHSVALRREGTLSWECKSCVAQRVKQS
jgi:hypothetical protein